MRTPHKFLWSGIVLALLAAALFYATPYLTLFRIHRAVERSDAEAVSHHVDFDLLRESVRAKVSREITRNAPQGAMAGLGQAVALGVANQMVDSVVSPAGVMRLMEGKGALAQLSGMVQKPAAPGAPVPPAPPAADGPAAAPAPQAAAARERVRIRVSYQDWSQVRVSLQDTPGALVFRRDGWVNWRLSAIDWPEDVELPLPLPQRR
jgi:hypothetical protein